MRKSDVRAEERRAADAVREERITAIEIAAGKLALKAVTTRRRPVWTTPLVGAAVRREPAMEYEAVPLPGASAFLGSSLGGPLDVGAPRILRGPA